MPTHHRFLGLLDLVFPRTCLHCGRSLLGGRFRWLCPRCQGEIVPLGPVACPVCSAVSFGASGCRDCKRLHPRFAAAIAVGRYEGVLRDLVTGLKFGRRTLLGRALGDLLAQTVVTWERAADADLVVPVPLAPGRRWRRGFNQAWLLAAAAARELGVPARQHILTKRGGGTPQRGRSRRERLVGPRRTMGIRDLRGSLAPVLARTPARVQEAARGALDPGLLGRRVLLVDDVMTTGATASEAARVLLSAGAAEVLVAVVARA